MDLLDFEGHNLYFDEALQDKVKDLIAQASTLYGEGKAERPLLRAYAMAPESLTVLVALYRFYFYQHRHDEAMTIARRAMEAAARLLTIPGDWRQLTLSHIGVGAMKSMGLVRFYLLALKAAGYLNVRLGKVEEARTMFRKVMELDTQDRLGVKALMELIDDTKEDGRPKLRLVSA